MYPIKKITLEHTAYVLVRLTERDSVDWKVNPLEGPYIIPKKLGFRASNISDGDSSFGLERPTLKFQHVQI